MKVEDTMLNSSQDNSIRKKNAKLFIGHLTPIFIAIFACFIYYLFRTNLFNGDGIGQIGQVIQHHNSPLISPRYLLYYPLLKVIYNFSNHVEMLRYIRHIQFIDTILAGIAMLLLFKLALYWTDSKLNSALITLSVAFSFVFWEHAIDVHYVMLGYTALLAALTTPIIFRNNSTNTRAVFSALAIFIAAACYLGNILCLPAVIWTLYQEKNLSSKQKRSTLIVFAAVLLIFAVLALIIVMNIVPNLSNAKAVNAWVGARNPYPGWSEFTSSTPQRSLNGIICSFQNFYTGLHLRDLAKGKIHPGLLPAQISLAMVIIMLLSIPIIMITYRRKLFSLSPGLWVFIFLWFIPFALFNAYQCAEDEQFWISTLAPILMMSLLTMQMLTKKTHLFAIIPILLFAGNLSSPIIEWHKSYNLESINAAINTNTFLKSNDLIISPTYDWTSYISLVSKGQIYCLPSLADRSTTNEKTLARLSLILNDAQNKHGRTFISSLDKMDNKKWNWIESITKLHRKEVLSITGKRVWTSHGYSLWELYPKKLTKQ